MSSSDQAEPCRAGTALLRQDIHAPGTNLMTDHPANHRCLRTLIIVAAMHGLACRAQTGPASVAQRFDDLSQTERAAHQLPEREMIAVIGAKYDQMMAQVRKDRRLDRLDDADLDVLYRAAQLAAFYTHDRRHVLDMVSFLNGLQERGLASKFYYVQMYETFIGARMLTEAQALASEHPTPELEALPELHETAGVVPGRPTEWVVNPSERELLLQNVDLHQPAQVLIVSHPLCHFSRAAVRDIQADPVLSKVLAEHAKWLAPQDNHINFDVVQKWNQQHPGQEVAVAFRRDDWPMIDSWGTPTFYFLKDGEVTAKVEGWPKPGHRSELLAALQQIGLVQ